MMSHKGRGGRKGLPEMMVKSEKMGRRESLNIVTSPIPFFIVIIHFTSSNL